jgi:Carboxypeptidase regulatory-like domain
MTLFTKHARHDEKMLIDQEISHKLKTGLTVLIILISCLGSFTVIMISGLHGPNIFMAPFSFKGTVTSTPDNLGSVKGFVISSDGLPVEGVSIVAYKQMELINSEVKNIVYSSSVVTNSDGSYLFNDLPSGVYKFEVIFPDNTIQKLDSYAVWPSLSSSYDIKENPLLTM